MRYRKQITGIFAVGWMIFIFMMSAQPAEESSAISDSVSYKIVAASSQLLHQEIDEAELEEYAAQIHYPVRKAAHMTEYAVLAILLALYLMTDRKYAGKRAAVRIYAIAWLAAVIYAATDEYHQTFVAGRAGMVTDVCIDASGALIGILIFAGIHICWARHCKTKRGRCDERAAG